MAQPPAPRSSPLALTVLALLHYQPLHPYGIQRLIKQWGKDQVVNVEQRTSLYRTIERLLAAGLIAVRETGRDPRYPERTVYEITDSGRQTARRWLEEMLAEPRQEYPEFPSALSHLDCPRCGARHDADQVHGTCSCGSPLLARYDLRQVGISPHDIAGR